jgi:hypothetical protein
MAALTTLLGAQAGQQDPAALAKTMLTDALRQLDSSANSNGGAADQSPQPPQ